MNRVGAVVFDLFGVVFSRGFESSVDQLSALLGRNRYAIEPIYRKWETEFDLGHMDEQEFWRHVNADLGTNVPSDVLSKVVLSGYQIDPRVVSLARRLGEDRQIVVYSNYRSEWFSRLDGKFQVSEVFDDIYISSDIGLLKPSKEVFLWLADRLSLAPKSIAFIDDQRKNVESAFSAGMSGIHFRNVIQAATDFVDTTGVSFEDEYYSGVILQTRHGALILQRRDSHTAIAHPGMLSVFGGRRQPAEAAVDCAIRETEEEVGLSVTGGELSPLGSLMCPIEDDRWMYCSYFLIRNVDVGTLSLKEGKDFEIYWPDVALRQQDLVFASKIAIQRFIGGIW